MTKIEHNELDDSVLERVVGGSISQAAFPNSPVRVYPTSLVYPQSPIDPSNPIYPQNPVYPTGPVFPQNPV